MKTLPLRIIALLMGFLALPVTYVAFIPKNKSADERAVARGWTIKTFPGTHVAMTENPRGVATLIEQSVNDRNKPGSKN